MAEQFLSAIKSFKTQTHINITLAAVETAFSNTSHKNDSAWLIQWVINNKLVCNITLYFLFNTDILIRSTNSLFVSKCKKVTHR
jgi:hypothetical protein